MELSETVVENGETEMSPEESREHKEEISEAEPVGGSLGGGRPPEEGAQEMMEEEEEIPKPKSVVAPPGAPKKEHVNVVFIGHVDAGKSTIGGQIIHTSLFSAHENISSSLSSGLCSSACNVLTPSRCPCSQLWNWGHGLSLLLSQKGSQCLPK
ncbi:eukaryotic peptide chain release factor GTP-binding subunit ERF3A-like isoform X1 [Manis pentadactyla]|uniref:eukaryotic peptide chain release factor GTP-binding subunit ERF3A-like isoform X1 n=1 Tax=Manis pentadactyla TaxID=143292 RepID=UPI00255CB03E|nr:eukaryotic peptide chain release factor GTP-binding subunit ERF3A-like isoform X1 [Manis pentadactyla]XP_057364222.1 eukaryotic peptide chain release factor GTP-binding subunit ERF3A-like isoform X1 [Manis pentadactyla]